MRKLNRNFIYWILYAVWVTGIVLMLGSCRASAPATLEEQAALETLVETRDFVFNAEFATPLASQAYLNAANLGFAQARGNSQTRINLTGEGYYLALDGDSIDVNLPFFGSRNNVTNYNNRGGIELETTIEDLAVKKTSKGYELEFFAQEDFERFRMILMLSPNNSAELSVFSPQRDVIRYFGKIHQAKE